MLLQESFQLMFLSTLASLFFSSSSAQAASNIHHDPQSKPHVIGDHPQHQFIFSGTLISPTWVVTATHCCQVTHTILSPCTIHPLVPLSFLYQLALPDSPTMGPIPPSEVLTLTKINTRDYETRLSREAACRI